MLHLSNRLVAATAAVAASLVTLAVGTAPALAETVSIPVRYTDLDLSTASGTATLNRRIAIAADRICGPKSMMNHFEIISCRHVVIVAAQKEVSAVRAKRAAVVVAQR